VKQMGTGPQGPARYIAIEGATAAGKTTLAGLSARLGGTLELDPFDRNPFLAEYCQATPGRRAAVALPMEMAFLALRVGALRGIGERLTQGASVVADWALAKSRVFTACTLGADDAELFSRTVDLWTAHLPVPDLVVHLRADPQTLAARVRSRGRGMEKCLAAAELAAQDGLFSTILAQAGLNVVTVDASAFNVFSEPEVAHLTYELALACGWAA
jgi:deoxyguanosine kinase